MCVFMYVSMYVYRVTPSKNKKQKNRTHTFFITSTKIKQNNSNFVH